MTTQKKITLSTFKSFIRKNAGKILVQVRREFDGMVDGVRDTEDRSFTPALPSDRHSKHTCGICGVWLVLGSRDYFHAYEDETRQGILVSNCCGSFVLAVEK